MFLNHWSCLLYYYKLSIDKLVFIKQNHCLCFYKYCIQSLEQIWIESGRHKDLVYYHETSVEYKYNILYNGDKNLTPE